MRARVGRALTPARIRMDACRARDGGSQAADRPREPTLCWNRRALAGLARYRVASVNPAADASTICPSLYVTRTG